MPRPSIGTPSGGPDFVLRGLGGMLRVAAIASWLGATVGCGEPAAPIERKHAVDATGTYALLSVDGAAVPTRLYGTGAAVWTTGGWIRLDAGGTYESAIAARLETGTDSIWEIERGGGTYTTEGSTINFGDSGDGEGPFTGSLSGNRLTINDLFELVFLKRNAVDDVDVAPHDHTLTSCAALQLTATATDVAGDPAANPAVSWETSDHTVATVDTRGVITPVANGSATVFATLDAGVDSAVIRVDYAVPSAVTIQPIPWNADGFPEITWTEADDGAFCDYRVGRTGNWGSSIGSNDSIIDRLATTYVDTGVARLTGISLDYWVDVRNGPHVVASDTVHLEVGVALPVSVAADPTRRPILNPVRDEFYLLTEKPSGGGPGDTLVSVSTTSNTVVRRRWVGSRPFVLSADGGSLYVLSKFLPMPPDTLYTADVVTFSDVASVPVPYSGRMVAGRPGRLHMEIVDFPAGTSTLKTLDVSTGAEVGTVLITSDVDLARDASTFTLSADHQTLYVVKPDAVFKIDVATDSAVVLAQSATPFAVNRVQLSPDGTRLYLANPFIASASVEIWDTATLTSVGQIPAQEVHFVYVDDSGVFVSQAVGDPRDRYFKSGAIVRYDANTLTETASWRFVLVPTWFVVTRDGTTLYAPGPINKMFAVSTT